MLSTLLRRIVCSVLRALPEPRMPPRERMLLSAQAIDIVREITRNFSVESNRLNAPMVGLQRPVDLACDLMDFVDPTMSLLDYVSMASGVLTAWNEELSRKRPRRREFCASMRNAMFTDNDAGWQRYAAHMGKELDWFTAGLA